MAPNRRQRSRSTSSPARSRRRSSPWSGRPCCRHGRSSIRGSSNGSWRRSSAAGSASATSPGSPSRASYLMREIGTDSVVVIGGEDGRPRAFLNVCRHRGARLDRGAPRDAYGAGSSAPTTAGPTGSTASCKATPAHGGGRGLRHLVLGPDAGAGRDRRGPGPRRPQRRGAGRRDPRRRARRLPRALRVGALRRAGERRPTRWRRTGRRSPRTTASAFTAPASTRSSTGSATT